MHDLTGRTDFVETWLLEMPEGLGKFSTFDQIEYILKDRIRHGGLPVNVTDTVKKIVSTRMIYYWVEINNEIALGVELLIKPQGLIVTLVGKNPKFVGLRPFASEMYDIILKDNRQSLRLVSDVSLSDEGYAIWKRLLQQGHKISVYDASQPGKSFVTLNSIDDMQAYFKYDDTNFRKYQFVLSESGEMIAETRGFFSTRRFRELIPGLL